LSISFRMQFKKTFNCGFPSHTM